MSISIKLTYRIFYYGVISLCSIGVFFITQGFFVSNSDALHTSVVGLAVFFVLTFGSLAFENAILTDAKKIFFFDRSKLLDHILPSSLSLILLFSLIIAVNGNGNIERCEIDWGPGNCRPHSEYVDFSSIMKLVIYLWIPFFIVSVANFLSVRAGRNLKNRLNKRNIFSISLAILCFLVFIFLGFKNGPATFHG